MSSLDFTKREKEILYIVLEQFVSKNLIYINSNNLSGIYNKLFKKLGLHHNLIITNGKLETLSLI